MDLNHLPKSVTIVVNDNLGEAMNVAEKFKRLTFAANDYLLKKGEGGDSACPDMRESALASV